MNTNNEHRKLREYYDNEYHLRDRTADGVSRHLYRMASKLLPVPGMRLLDVACGRGEWILAATRHRADAIGADISVTALDSARRRLQRDSVVACVGEALPFPDALFDFVSCLGALEHFPDKAKALGEMRRVVAVDGRVLILVPNAGFLTRRLGLFSGTEQAAIREDVLDLDAWREMFEQAGFMLEKRWRDLHVLSSSWLLRRGWLLAVPRLLQALALTVWPLSWQYQVYHLLRPSSDPR